MPSMTFTILSFIHFVQDGTGGDADGDDEDDQNEEEKEAEGFESLAPEDNGQDEGPDLAEDEPQPQVRYNT